MTKSAVSFGGTGDDVLIDVLVLPDNDVIVVGFFHGDVPFGGTTLHANGGADAFVARLRH
jgi:hypothetical protein